MKIIHTADIHLDSRLDSVYGSEKAQSRRAEILENFVSMIDYAVREGVKAILISGDLFDVKRISATARNRVLGVMECTPLLDFYYLQGNHDINSFLEDINEIPSNLHIFNDKWTSYCIGTDGAICISGIEINSENRNYLYDSLFLPYEKMNIVMMHGQDMEYGSGDKTEVINISALRNKNINYLALGHIHSYKEAQLDKRGVMIYPGCLDPRGFDESGLHGFVLLDIDEKTLDWSYELIPFASRIFHEVEVDITDLYTTAAIISQIEETLKEANIPGKDMVKIILTGYVDVETELDEMLIEKRFESSFFALKITNQTRKKIDYENFSLDKSLKGAFVREVMTHDELSEEEKTRIIAYGLAAIRNERIDLCD